jgi:hypothetical protein
LLHDSPGQQSAAPLHISVGLRHALQVRGPIKQTAPPQQLEVEVHAKPGAPQQAPASQVAEQQSVPSTQASWLAWQTVGLHCPLVHRNDEQHSTAVVVTGAGAALEATLQGIADLEVARRSPCR